MTGFVAIGVSMLLAGCAGLSMVSTGDLIGGRFIASRCRRGSDDDSDR